MNLDTKYNIHKSMCEGLNPLYVRKNTDYGDSVGKSIDDSGYMAVIIRMDDKMRRIKSLLNTTSVDEVMVKEESVEDTLLDLANYALILATEVKIRSGKN